MSDWKPGDVALIHVDGNAVVAMRGVRQWGYTPDGKSFTTLYDASQVTDARRLVVIDPEDREQVERLVASLEGRSFSVWGCGAVSAAQAALREFANPKPPRPEEPTGLAGVVRYDGSEWVGLDKHRWLEIPMDERVEPRRWHWNDFPADVEVIREGWGQ